MPKIFVSQRIPGSALERLKKAEFEVDVSPIEGIMSSDELLSSLKAKPYDGLLSLLTNTIDKSVFDACPTLKIVSNYAVGFNNIDLDEAKKRGIVVANTPGQSISDSVAEHTFALMLALMRRVAEGDRYMREGKYKGWDPELLLGEDLRGKTLGILGAGRIGEQVIKMAVRGFDMTAVYYDVVRHKNLEEEYKAMFVETPEELLKMADVVTIHVPLLPTTKHLINAERLKMMKSGAYLINTSRGPVVDEKALYDALKNNQIRGAALDVFEFEPNPVSGLDRLSNIILTPHIASATFIVREEMSQMAVENLIDFFAGRDVKRKVV